MPHTNHYRSIVQLIDEITDSHDLGSVLNGVLDTLVDHFQTPRGAILVPNRRGLLEIAAQQGLDQDAALPKVTLDDQDLQQLEAFKHHQELPRLQIIELLGKPRGIVLLGHRGDGQDYDEEDQDYIAAVADIGALAMDYQQLIQRLSESVHTLDSKVSQLSSLFELSKEFSAALDPQIIGQLLVFNLVQQFRVENFAVVGLRQTPPRIIEARMPRARLKELLEETDLSSLNTSLGASAVEHQYPGFAELGVELMVPVSVFGQIGGVIFLGGRRDHQSFSASDVDYVAALGGLAIIAAENSRLFQAALEKERLEQDLAVARTIQQNLLPRTFPETGHFRLAGFNQPAHQVGGDYYDVISLDKDRLVIAIADVAGKGVHSALLMANLQAFLEALCHQSLSLENATARLNAYLAEHAPAEMFVTFFWGLLDDQTLGFHYVNAGHNPPILLRDGQMQWLDTGGLVLGALNPAPPFQVAQLTLQPGDLMVAYTDGITEARSPSGELFGETRLVETLKGLATREADALIADLTEAVRQFTAESDQADDITCLVVRVL